MPTIEDSQAPQRFSAEDKQTDTGRGNETQSVQPTLSLPTLNDPGEASVAVERTPSPWTRYRPLRTHARGGLGEVFVAHDGELQREVALKRIQAPFADIPEARQRFLREAHITGGLEHPGIAPVYGLGTDADGRPYYAMRLIRGESLREALKRFHAAAEKPGQSPRRCFREAFRGLEFRKLLQRFVELCNIVEYAHSRGVLHRDLKPANVMLGRYGETLVMDWGLARALDQSEPEAESSLGPLAIEDSETSLTRDGSVVGTPAYMSPEQADGRTHAISTRSDIYSLGATLYTILTSRPPFEGEHVERLLQQVAGGDFPPPRAVRPEVSRRLEAICLKAMSRRPADRYASCAALAEDVEYWLADEPVSVLPDPLSARLFRWMRRRRTAVASAAAAILVAVVAMTIATILLAKANRNLTDLNVREAAATQRALAAAVEVQRQEERATQSYRLAKDALDEVMKLQQDPRFEQGPLEDVQRKLQQVEAEFYEKFVVLQSDNDEFQLERARAFQKLAYFEQLQGSWEEAVRRHETSIAILAPLAKRRDRAQPRSMLAYGQAALAAAYTNTGKRSLALATYEKAEKTLEDLIRDFPDVPEYPNHLALVLKNHGVAYFNLGQSAETARLYQRALEIRRALVAAHPGVPRFRNDLASTLQYLANYHAPTAPEESARFFEEALKTFEDVVRDQFLVIEYQCNLASCLTQFAGLHRMQNRWQEAEPLLARAIAILEPLHKDHPYHKNFAHDLGRAYREQGSLYALQEGRERDSAAAMENAVRILGPLADAHPSVAMYLNDVTFCSSRLVNLYEKLGDADRRAEEEAKLTELIKRSEQLTAAASAESISDNALAALNAAISARPDGAALYYRRGALFACRGEWKQASADFLRTLELSPQQHWYWYMNGPVLLLSGDLEGYRAYCRRAIEQHGATEDPVIAERTAKLCLLTPEPPVDLEKLAALSDLAVTKGADHQYLAYFQLVRGMAAFRQGHYDESLAWIEKSGFLSSQRNVAVAVGTIFAGMAYHQLGQSDKAKPLLEETFVWLDDQPISENGANIDWQMCQIIRREAETLLQAGDAK
jgi:serine/threonine-protein kinase